MKENEYWHRLSPEDFDLCPKFYAGFWGKIDSTFPYRNDETDYSFEWIDKEKFFDRYSFPGKWFMSKQRFKMNISKVGRLL